MKTEEDVQRAHDLLTGIILGEVPGIQLRSEADRDCLSSAIDVLCWMLGHDHNTAFADNLLNFEAAAFGKGFALRRATE